MISVPIPAAMISARRRVVDHFGRAGATAPDSAVAYIPTRRIDRNALAYLQRHGVVSLADGGRYWLDETKAAELERSTKAFMAIAIGGAVAAVAAVMAFTR